MIFTLSQLKQASSSGYLPPSRVQTAQSQQPMVGAVPVPHAFPPVELTHHQALILEEPRPGWRPLHWQRSPPLLLPLMAFAVPLNPLNYTGSRRTDILQEQRPA